MRTWLLVAGFLGLAAAAVWLGVHSRRPSTAAPQPAAADPAAPAAPRSRPPMVPPPLAAAPAPAAPAPEAPASAAAPAARSTVPRFDPALEKLLDAARGGDLQRAAAQNGFKLTGDRVRVLVRADLGGADKARAAITAAGGDVLRTIQRGEDQTIYVALVPVRALRSLSENEAVRNVHRPVGMHAAEEPGPPRR